MADEPDDSVPSNDGSVVDPEDLDIEDDEHVKPLGDNRYVVSADEKIAEKDDGGSAVETAEKESPFEMGAESSTEETETTPEDEQSSGDSKSSGYDGDAVGVHRARARLTERMVERGGAYGFDVTAQFGDQVVQQHLQANDIVTVFDALLLWYAEHLDDETPAEEAIGILLAESDIPVEYPPNALIELVRSHGLDGSDTIADLVDTACDDTVQFPPQ